MELLLGKKTRMKNWLLKKTKTSSDTCIVLSALCVKRVVYAPVYLLVCAWKPPPALIPHRRSWGRSGGGHCSYRAPQCSCNKSTSPILCPSRFHSYERCEILGFLHKGREGRKGRWISQSVESQQGVDRVSSDYLTVSYLMKPTSGWIKSSESYFRSWPGWSGPSGNQRNCRAAGRKGRISLTNKTK